MRLRIKDDRETETFEYGDSKIEARKLTIEDSWLLEQEATTDGLVDERDLRRRTWNRIITGWSNVVDARGVDIEYDAEQGAAYIHDGPEGPELRGVGPGLPSALGKQIWNWAHFPVVAFNAVVGNSEGSSRSEAKTASAPGIECSEGAG